MLRLHPLDGLESRLTNIVVLPSKRDNQGIAQADLAIDITRVYLEHLGRDGRTPALLNAIERVARFALDKGLASISHDFSLNPLTAVLVEMVTSEEFHKQRWPQLLTLVAEQRKDYAHGRAGAGRRSGRTGSPAPV